MVRAKAPGNRLPPWGPKEDRPQGCRRSSSWRRKEVALGRLSTLTVILIFGAWGAATEGASPDDAAPSPAAAVRKPAPVPPIKYLEAGARLFNSGNFELAAKYLDAAQMYRDQLQQDEQTTLDAYLKELSKVQASATRPGGSSTSGSGHGGSSPAAPADREPAARPAATAAPATPTVVQTGDATPRRCGRAGRSRPTPSSRGSGCSMRPGSRSPRATTTRPRRRSPRPRPWTSSGACSTTRPPRSETS